MTPEQLMRRYYALFNERRLDEADVALREAQGLARSPLARYLPGWSGITVPPADSHA